MQIHGTNNIKLKIIKMKKTLKFLSAIVLGAAVAFGTTSCNVKSQEEKQEAGAANRNDSTVVAAAGSIVYVDLARVMSEYGMAIDLSATFSAKQSSINDELTRKQTSLQNAYNKFNDEYGKGKYTPSVAETKMKAIQKQETDFQQYAQQKAMEIEQEGLVISNQINDAVATFIKNYREKMGYAMILLTEGDMPNDGIVTISTVLAADPSLDITDAVIAGLNAEYNPEAAE